MKRILFFTLLMTTSLSFACELDGSKGIAPDNNIKIPTYMKTDSPITEESFFKVIEQVENVYKPIMKEMGQELEIIKDWTNATANAYAKKQGSTSIVHMFGGLARHPKMTEDGFTLVVCHEIGHHIGGAPRKSAFFGLQKMWASNEGQSDYWATLKCARKAWENDDNQAIVSKMSVPAIVNEKCEKAHGTGHDFSLCQRSSMAGFSLALTLDALRKGSSQAYMLDDQSSAFSGGSPSPKNKTPDFSTPSTAKRTWSTDHNHPQAQCRLDTYFMGALCDEQETNDVDPNDPNIGTCNRKQGTDFGARPLCWYKA